MNTVELLRACRQDTVIAPSFAGVFPADCLPKPKTFPASFIANYDPSKKPGSHWVGVILWPEKRGEMFSSYGDCPPQRFQTYMNKQCQHWDHNLKCVQAPLTATCGNYAIYFLHERLGGVGFTKFLSGFSTDLIDNDEFVVEYINDRYNLDTELFDTDFLVKQLCQVFKGIS